MRTKALLSVAAIAASAISAMAQGNVYSLNIVGYATVSIPSGFSLLANPLSAGVTNGANEIMPIIDGEHFLTWNGAGFNEVIYDSTAFPTPGWVKGDDTTPTVPPSLPPGKGFFYFNPGASATNITFVGQVVPNPGGAANANTNPLPSGFSLLGSALPATVAQITNAPVSLPSIDGMHILTFNGKGYDEVILDSTAFPTPGWVKADDTTPTVAPPYTIGEGFFFFNAGAASSWVQSLP